MLVKIPQRLAERPVVGARASKPTGSKYGRVPTSLVAPTSSDRHLSPETTALIAYRSLHTDQKRPWSCMAGRMRRAFRKGFGRKIFQRAIQEGKDSGNLMRWQGTVKPPSADGRGRGFAVDRLIFGRLEHGYVIVDRQLFDGHLTPSEVTTALFLRARGSRLTRPWQIGKRLGRHKGGKFVKAARGTVNAIMKTLTSHGLATNHGTRGSPLWAHATVQNPTLKNTALKKATLLRTTTPERQISPSTCELTKDAGQIQQSRVGAFSSCENTKKRTDGIGAIAAALTAAAASLEGTRGSAMKPLDKYLLITDRTLQTVHLLGVDPGEMLDRLHAAADKRAAQGGKIADPNAYMLEMAKREAEKNGVMVECVEDITSPNEWKRGAALAKAVGMPTTPLKAPTPGWPDEPQRKRIAAQLEGAGLNPAEIEQKWLDACRNRTTRADYPQFAGAERMNARHPRRAVR